MMIAPQAFTATTVPAAAQCGQRVNEWGQAATRHHETCAQGTPPGASCPRLVPTLARDIHALSTRSPPTRTPPPASLRTRRDTADADRRFICGPANRVGGWR